MNFSKTVSCEVAEQPPLKKEVVQNSTKAITKKWSGDKKEKKKKSKLILGQIRHKKMWLTLCTALSCWISWRDTWPTLCWGSWRRTSLYRSALSCTASRTRSSRYPSRRGSLKNEVGREADWKREDAGTDRLCCHPQERETKRQRRSQRAETPERPVKKNYKDTRLT